MKIREFQEHIRKIYYKHDYRRGVKKTLEWFITEVYEFVEAVEKGDKRDISLEAADVIAWLSSVLTLLNIDLEEAAFERYGKGCPKCNSIPCRCTYREEPNKKIICKESN